MTAMATLSALYARNSAFAILAMAAVASASTTSAAVADDPSANSNGNRNETAARVAASRPVADAASDLSRLAADSFDGGRCDLMFLTGDKAGSFPNAQDLKTIQVRIEVLQLGHARMSYL